MSLIFVSPHICPQLLSCVPLFVTAWAVAHQPPLSMRFSRQEYWVVLSFSSYLEKH